MQITITGQHLEITPALDELIRKKIERLARKSKKISHTHVVLTLEKKSHQAEITLHIGGEELHASAESHDMYETIDLLAEKIDRQVAKWKEQDTEHD